VFPTPTTGLIHYFFDERETLANAHNTSSSEIKAAASSIAG